jgi:hypothetical protein
VRTVANLNLTSGLRSATDKLSLSGLAIGTSLRLPVVYFHDSSRVALTGGMLGTPPAGYRYAPVGSPRFAWHLYVKDSSAGAKLQILGCNDITMATARPFVICEDVSRRGDYSSLQTRLLAYEAGSAPVNALEWVSPFPFWMFEFVNGDTVMSNGSLLSVRCGGY